ncbi:hypothetical protein D3C81_1462040 [compost metagenome]
MQRILIVHEALGGGDHPLLARLAFIGGQVAAAAHQAVGHARVDLGQLRHRRLVRQAARAEEQHPLVQRAGETPDGLAEQAGALEAWQWRRHRVDEDRQHRPAVEAAKQEFQRLGESVVHLHAVGYASVDTGRQHRRGAGFGQLAGHRQRPGGAAEVADGMGRHADAEGRHDVVEETVEMVGGEQDHQLRIEAGDPLAGLGDDLVDFGQHLWRRVHVADQRGVRKALQIGSHLEPLWPARGGDRAGSTLGRRRKQELSRRCRAYPLCAD